MFAPSRSISTLIKFYSLLATGVCNSDKLAKLTGSQRVASMHVTQTFTQLPRAQHVILIQKTQDALKRALESSQSPLQDIRGKKKLTWQTYSRVHQSEKQITTMKQILVLDLPPEGRFPGNGESLSLLSGEKLSLGDILRLSGQFSLNGTT